MNETKTIQPPPSSTARTDDGPKATPAPKAPTPAELRMTAQEQIGKLEDEILRLQDRRTGINEDIKRLRSEIGEWRALLPRKRKSKK